MSRVNFGKFVVLSAAVAYCALAPDLAAADVERVLAGRIALWKRPACAEPANCPNPAPLGVEFPVSIHLTKPETPGAATRAELALASAPWKVLIAFYWVLPSDGSVDFVVTQTRLAHDEFGLVAEGSRYDRIDEIEPFPVGACSGRMGEEMLGLSLFRD